MKKSLIIWGATGQSIVLEEILNQNYDIVAMFDNNQNIRAPFDHIPLYFQESGFNDWLSQASDLHQVHYIVAIGGKHGKQRLEIHKKLKEIELIATNAIHKTAYVSKSAELMEGVQIMAHANICARASLGVCTIVNTAASVDHECKLFDGVHIGPGATLAGGVTVGRNSFIGAGSVVLPNLSIGENVVVGAGSVVTRHIESNTVGYGNPFRAKS